MLAADVHHPAVGAALATAADLLGMEVVFVGLLTADDFSFARVRGEMPGVAEGMTLPRAHSFCDRLLQGAPAATADAAADPAYADVPARETFGITSYVGVPVRGGDGAVFGTLCGMDRGSVAVSTDVLPVLCELAGVVGAHVTDDNVIRRTSVGWRVGSEDVDGIVGAMALADLLAEDLATSGRPPRADEAGSEVERLRIAVTQLEHALLARVTVEQAIGVLAERQHLTPRAAFEKLRKAARSRGKRVHDLARLVVASTSDPGVPMPPELAGRR